MTGAAFGQAIPFFLIPAANFKVYGANKKTILKNLPELFAVLALTVLSCLAVLYGWLPYLAVSLIITSSFIFLIGRIAYTIIARIKPLAKRRLLATAGAAFCVLSVLYLISACILQPLKVMLIK
jgi:hypothetical protein